jgi:hypothetical protein
MALFFFLHVETSEVWPVADQTVRLTADIDEVIPSCPP